MQSLSGKISIPPLAIAAVLLVATFTATSMAGAGDSVSAEGTAEVMQFVGEYRWTSQRDSGRLDVFFVETGDGVYDVDFKFRFRGVPHTYSGTAEGSLTEGRLEGEVFNENRRRRWIFEGECENGKFSGEHREITRFGERRTGTLSFAP